MKKLRINGGQLTLTTDQELTLRDITGLAEAAIEAQIPATATVTYVTINFNPGSSSRASWELMISWHMPKPEINIEKELGK